MGKGLDDAGYAAKMQCIVDEPTLIELSVSQVASITLFSSLVRII